MSGAFLRLQELFDAALELPAEEQDRFAARECADDPTLGDELLRLLRRHRGQRVVPDQPALDELDRALRAADPQALAEGRMVGPFRIERTLADGGMGRVYRAVREHDGIVQRVAIKLVRPELVSAALLQRFSAERRLLASLDHPGICRFIDAGMLADDTPFVVMELVDGRSITAYCDAERLSLTARLALLRKVLAAVAHAHRKLIVHRDIKPPNVLVDASGEPRLLDFGIAKSLVDEPTATATAERFFSPASAAPEQLRGDPITVGCDIYAIGVLAYELLGGRLPFDFAGLRPGEIERLLLEVPPLPMSQRIADGDGALAEQRGFANVREWRRALQGDLDTIVQTCLRKSPGERYATVEQLDAELANVLEGRPVQARRGERLYRLRKFVGRHRLAVGLSSVLAGTVLAAAAAIVQQNFAITEQRNVALRERDRAQQVVTLLQDAFTAADPSRSGASKITAEQILQAARPRIEQFFDTNPDVYASLAATIAKLDLDLDRTEGIRELTGRALVAARRAGDAPLLRDLLVLDARGAIAGNEYDSARAVLEEARALDATPQQDWLIAQAMMLRGKEQLDEAIAALERAVELGGQPHADVELGLTARAQLADTLQLAQQHQRSLDVVDASIAWQTQRFGPDYPRIVLDRLRRVRALRFVGRIEEATAEGFDVVAKVNAQFGPTSSTAGKAQFALALALSAGGRYAEAADAYRHVIDVYAIEHGKDSHRTMLAEFNYAEALGAIPARSDEADAAYRHVIDRLEREFGPINNSATHMRSTYARFLLTGGRALDALTLLTRSPPGDIGKVYWENRETYRGVLRDAYAGAGCPRASEPRCGAAERWLDAIAATFPPADAAQ